MRGSRKIVVGQQHLSGWGKRERNCPLPGTKSVCLGRNQVARSRPATGRGPYPCPAAHLALRDTRSALIGTGGLSTEGTGIGVGSSSIGLDSCGSGRTGGLPGGLGLPRPSIFVGRARAMRETAPAGPALATPWPGGRAGCDRQKRGMIPDRAEQLDARKFRVGLTGHKPHLR